MDANTLIASLQEAVPAAQIESVPSRDLHATVYVSSEELLPVAEEVDDGLGAHALIRDVSILRWSWTMP